MIINNLSFKFDTTGSIYFFKELTAEFTSHKVHFIQGDNGVGKSTLFTILQGARDSFGTLTGSVTLDGITYTAYNNRLPRAFTQQVHTVQQDYNAMIAQQFTFIENLQLANLPRYPHVRSLPQATLFESINLLGIDPEKPAYLLSGGQRQLLAILMALQKPTKILLLDEPTATLDKKNAQLIMQCLYTLSAHLNVTMVMICHDKELVEQYAQGNSFLMQEGENGQRILTAL